MHVNDYNETFQIKHLHLFRQKFSVILIYQKIKESKLYKVFLETNFTSLQYKVINIENLLNIKYYNLQL